MAHNRRSFLKGLAAITGMSMLSLQSTAGKLMAESKYNTKKNVKMKLSWMPFDLQLKYAFGISNFTRTTTPVVLVAIEYDGLIGFGEASLPPYLGESQPSVISFLQRVDLSSFNDPLKLDEILTYVDSIAINNTAAKAAIDIALHDLAGKIIGKPWHQIWGLDATLTPDTTYTIGIDTDDVIAKKVKEVKGQFNLMKVKLGSDDDKRIINAVKRHTDLPIAVDANQGWKDKHFALDMIHWLHEQGVVMVEQPLNKFNLDDSAWLTERSPIPIYADESMQRLTDVERMRGAFSGINIKLMKCTGMREAWKMRNFAEALGMDVMLGCMTETSCAISAAAQLSPGLPFVDLDGSLLISNDVFDGAKLDKGRMMPNNRPGIGIEPIKGFSVK